MIKREATIEETELITKILDRYQQNFLSLGIPKSLQRSRLDIMMDIEAVHCNGNPLDLERLLAADDFNFTHDLIGIQTHLDRNTGQLMNCFVPRYSK